jgi:hypothetical protein
MIQPNVKMFFIFRNKRYKSFRSWCDDYGVKYTSAKYALNKFVKGGVFEQNYFLFDNEDFLRGLAARYGVEIPEDFPDFPF